MTNPRDAYPAEWQPLAVKLAPDGRHITVDPFYTFGKVRVSISSHPGNFYDDQW